VVKHAVKDGFSRPYVFRHRKTVCLQTELVSGHNFAIFDRERSTDSPDEAVDEYHLDELCVLGVEVFHLESTEHAVEDVDEGLEFTVLVGRDCSVDALVKQLSEDVLLLKLFVVIVLDVVSAFAYVADFALALFVAYQAIPAQVGF